MTLENALSNILAIAGIMIKEDGSWDYTNSKIELTTAKRPC